MKKAITHLKLDRANLSKINKLDELAAEHQQVVQAYVDWLIAHGSASQTSMPPYPKRKCRHRCLTAGSAAPGSKPVGLCSPGIAMRGRTDQFCEMCASRPTPMSSSSSLPTRRNSISGCGFPHSMPGIRCAYRSPSMSGQGKRWPNSQSYAAASPSTGVTMSGLPPSL